MSPNPKARRLSSVITEPFDPLSYGPQQWVDDDDGDDTTSANANMAHAAPGFDPSYPFSPYLPQPGPNELQPGWQSGPDGGLTQFESPKNSPLLRPTAMPTAPYDTDLSHDVVSPLSPAATFQKYSPRHPDQGFQSLQIPPTGLNTVTLYDGGGLGRNNTTASTYAMPPPPPPEPQPEGYMDYDQVRFSSSALDKRASMRHSRQGLSRQGSRLGSRMMGSIRRSGSSMVRWGTTRRSQGNLQDVSRDYMELGNVEDRDVPIGFDVSTLGPEFAVPTATAKAMQEHHFDDDLAYTGTGEAVDLSNLIGFDDGNLNDESEPFSPVKRAGTIENTNKQSFYFSPGRHVPNWKPIVLQTWYLIFLILLTVTMMIAIELLYQASDRDTIRKGGGLFAYVNIEELTVLQFAVWKYVPTMVGVLYGILWKVTDEELKRSEPYYQLSKGSTGALAAESLNIEYHTIWSPMVPVAALQYRQYIVAAGGFVSFLASSSVPIFMSVLIRVDPNQKERKAMKDQGAHVTKRLVVDGLWTRLLEAMLGTIVIFSSYIVWKLNRRRSGLLGDPSGIAGIAAMANKSHILMDFRDLDLATEEQIHKQLNKRTYILHKGALWQAQVLRESERDQSAPKAMNPHPLLLRLKGMGPFLGFCFIMLIILPVLVYNDTANIVIDKTPWIITGISILIKSIWELLEKEMRMLEPFWILYNRDAHSSVLTLDYSATIPGFIVLKALSKGHLLLAWVTFVTILIEILTVVLGSLDTQGQEESTLSSQLSFALSLVIFVVVIFTGVLVLMKRRHPFLPRQPCTISSVLAFIHQSRMLTDFEGTEQQTTFQRKSKLNTIGKTYGFGWYIGRDGKSHLGIDHEPLLEGYKFGADRRKAVMDGPIGDFDRFMEES